MVHESAAVTPPISPRRSFWRPGRGVRTIGGWIVVGLFALLFAHDVWEAIGNFVGINYQRLALGLELTGWGWIILLGGLLAPVVLFFLALVVTRKMSAWRTLALFSVALFVSAVIALDITLAAPYGVILG
jgi:hypothetical protein